MRPDAFSFSGIYHSPVGTLEIQSSPGAITSIRFPGNDLPERKGSLGANALIDRCITQLEEYFRGNRQVFELPISPSGTAFQASVWKHLQQIPFGQTKSYSRMAIELGNPKVIRAAASANGANPIAIVIPCHRVIGSDGRLVGYSGGIWRKEWLLRHESTLSGSFSQLELF